MLIQTGKDNGLPFPIEDREGELRGAIKRLCELLAQMASPQRPDAVILIAVPFAPQAYQ